MNADTQKRCTVSHLAEIANAQLVGPGNAQVCRAAPFDAAQADCITFALNDKILENIADCKAAAVIVGKKVDSPVPLLVVDNVERALIAVLKEFLPQLDKPAAGIHKSAVVEEGALIDKTA